MLERFTRLPIALQKAARWVRLGPEGGFVPTAAPSSVIETEDQLGQGASGELDPRGGPQLPGAGAGTSGKLDPRGSPQLPGAGAPGVLVHPDWGGGAAVPVVIWMHGRTAKKEIDPGRYLRLIRSGIGICALDLPGHGQRFDPAMQPPAAAPGMILQMLDEIDGIIDALGKMPQFDANRMGIGGISAGGMVTLARLCRKHQFLCASVEATTGSWTSEPHGGMFPEPPEARFIELDPASNLDSWREIPIQAIHCKLDEWVPFEGQAAFIEKLRARYENPNLIDLVTYDRTGAPFEHAGFGRHTADAKERQRAFFVRYLVECGNP